MLEIERSKKNIPQSRKINNTDVFIFLKVITKKLNLNNTVETSNGFVIINWNNNTSIANGNILKKAKITRLKDRFEQKYNTQGESKAKTISI